MTPHPILSLVLGLWASIQGPPEGHVSLWDLDRFPPKRVAKELYDLANAHYEWIENKGEPAEPWRRDEYWAWRLEADYCKDCWSELHAAYRKKNTDDERRDSLTNLRGRIGEEWYAQGRMPFPVPIHRFRRLD